MQKLKLTFLNQHFFSFHLTIIYQSLKCLHSLEYNEKKTNIKLNINIKIFIKCYDFQQKFSQTKIAFNSFFFLSHKYLKCLQIPFLSIKYIQNIINIL